MAIEDNIQDRKSAQSLFDSMLDLARGDFLKLSQRSRLIFMQIAFEHFSKRLGINQPAAEQKPSQQKPTIIRTSEVKSAIKDLEALIDLCDDVPDAGMHFAESVADGARDMLELISSSDFVTEKQLDAIDNWTNGISRWIR